MNCFNTKVTEYIINNWDSCVRFKPNDKDSLIGMPYPYIVPTAASAFQEMYYWDTYFTCKGLVLTDRVELAKNCAENMAFLIDKYGFMLNGNRTYYTGHSQAPYFCMIVKTVYDKTNDNAWLSRMYTAVEKEYDFWMTRRISPIGLNHYSNKKETEEEGKRFYEVLTQRVHYKKPISDYKNYADFVENAYAECESGWDFNPRFDFKCKSYAPADLNSNLYIYETTMAEFSKILENGSEQIWLDRANRRVELMNKYLWNGSFFADYNFVDNKFSPVFSAAAFQPLWAKIATKDQAKSTVSQLDKIEMNCGISACEDTHTDFVYQWSYPNSWAPLNFITAFALDNYGYVTDAARVAQKYVSAIESIFDKTGNLWEKYNAVDGSINVTNEYEMPDMLGWTAGVYLSLKKYLIDNDK